MGSSSGASHERLYWNSEADCHAPGRFGDCRWTSKRSRLARSPVYVGALGWCEQLLPAMPLFHAAGVAAIASTGIYYGAGLVLGITDRPLTPDMVVESLKHSGADGAMLPPSIIEEISHMEEGVEALAALKYVGFGGGRCTRTSCGD